MTQPDMSRRARYRIQFGKSGVLRYTSHLDLARLWERVLRRAGAPLIYSQGFNPRPQIQLAAALPLGFESTGEVVDIFLEADDMPSPAELLERIRSAAPEGLEVYGIEAVDYRADAMQSRRQAATYRVVPGESIPADDLRGRVAEMLASETLPRTRRKKDYDLRPRIIDISVIDDDPVTLLMQLVTSQQQGSGRPDEVLDELGLDPLDARVVRTALTFRPDGK